MTKDVKAALAEIVKRLVKLEAKEDPGAGAKTFGGKSAPKNVYAEKVKEYGGEADYAKQIRQRLAGYPESSKGIVGSWDNDQAAIAFRKANPKYF